MVYMKSSDIAKIQIGDLVRSKIGTTASTEGFDASNCLSPEETDAPENVDQVVGVLLEDPFGIVAGAVLSSAYSKAEEFKVIAVERVRPASKNFENTL